MAESTSAKKSSTRKTPSKKSSSSENSSAESSSRSGSAPRAEAPRRMSASRVAANAASELLELTGKEPEGIVGLERDGDGWKVLVEVVEVRRIPDTTDVLALYEVSTDDRGGMEGYRRVRRYARGVPGDD